ncbi:hypothetical protein K0M31_014705, partial [Melipona bicolor]
MSLPAAGNTRNYGWLATAACFQPFTWPDRACELGNQLAREKEISSAAVSLRLFIANGSATNFGTVASETSDDGTEWFQRMREKDVFDQGKITIHSFADKDRSYYQ